MYEYLSWIAVNAVRPESQALNVQSKLPMSGVIVFRDQSQD